MTLNDKEYLKNYDGPALRIMEVCGTHTAAIFRNGIRSLISPKIKLVSGPGCPVCVTVPSYIDRCIDLCLKPGYELLCFGDLLKIPGTERTLSDAKGAGGRVRMVWSPFDALLFAEQDPGTVFVVAAIGFETTIPAFGLLIEEAESRGIRNIRLLTSLKSALTAIDWICAAGEAIDAFLCPGHVSVITGSDAYIPLAKKYGKPFIVAGFEGEHLLAAIRAATEGVAGKSSADEGTASEFAADRSTAVEDEALEMRGCVRNLYPEAVSAQGNQKALEITAKYFEPCEAEWRGLGSVAMSGYYLKEAYRAYDAEAELAQNDQKRPQDKKADGTQEPSPFVCHCGDVILGRIDPDECPLFGTVCTPAHPIGPCMVSLEGACGTWYYN